MKSDQLINSVFESTKGMRRAEPSPFLYNKILAGISHRPEESATGTWIFAAAASVLLVLNIFCMSTVPLNKEQEKAQGSDDAYEMIQQVNYNY